MKAENCERAGPCAIESKDQMMAIAGAVKKAGASVLQGGAFKPRTLLYGFQRLGEEGLQFLREAGDRFDLLVVTKVMDKSQSGLVSEYADILQVGARNMQNFTLLSKF